MCCNDIISMKVRTVVARLNSKKRNIRPFREVSEYVPLLQKEEVKSNVSNNVVAVPIYPSLETITEDVTIGEFCFI